MQKTIFDACYHRLILHLRQRRLELGLRQEDVAQRLGINRSVVGKIEQCERRLDILEAWRLCLALDISLSDLESVLNNYDEGFDEER